ncbi:hypothetical protein [Gloeocapsa sp. PCC 73106]|uniref:hypothetical protein n=1 Tax=Gloeocapsa sp. PCC 73106 TaxID=102232 RepID=UPI0002AC798A|nr:hypothetical protein [Gloeocapsa sp. PCC 73106]ELR99975.1 hypothetical protein GLO73106DRAFT_00038290 [Gloeocapsa sp. PCC 73106]
MIVLVCPGFHPPALTQSFLDAFPNPQWEWRVFSGDLSPTLQTPVVLIGFSAGVVTALATTLALSMRQGNIKALIALDGWGVPLGGDFPIYRVSHDYFTHWSSALLGGGSESFYADPPVEHWELWRSPQTTKGWSVNSNGSKTSLTAAEFIYQVILCK